MQQVEVLGFGIDTPAARPVLLLQEIAGRRVLPVWIGPAETAAVELALREVSTERPGTHQLIQILINRFGRRLERVGIVGLHDGIFHAALVFDDETRVSARPSDAVALALRSGSVIEVAESVLEAAGVDVAELVDATETDEDVLPPAPVAAEDQAEELMRFRRFLDTAAPEDFGTD